MLLIVQREAPAQYPPRPDPVDEAVMDEAQGGMTLRGTPVFKRTEECFPTEPRDIFRDIDRVIAATWENDNVTTRAMEICFDTDLSDCIDDTERDAIRGRNTWMLWGEGNEGFWGWLQENAYGVVDFLVLIDSRKRGSRFATAGLMNQPGMTNLTSRGKPRKVLGLYLDIVQETMPNTQRDDSKAPSAPNDENHTGALFEVGDERLYNETMRQLKSDGVSPNVYGYPSGVVGLRLWPNPDFFGRTEAAEKARRYWDERVVAPNNDAYYTDSDVNGDPNLIRPFRVSMSCGFCHVAPHPLFPPDDPENPKWENMSSILGNQYWKSQPVFANMTKPDNILYHYTRSQLAGTVDTSMVSTDHINNANSIISIFDAPARLERAARNEPEAQSREGMLQPSIEESMPSTNPRRFPRVLIDGADSVGAFSALSRVYINIGTHYEQWNKCHNPLIGFTPQRPYSVEAAEKNSVFWRVGQRYRVPYLAAYFTMMSRASKDMEEKNQQSVAAMRPTAPMKFYHLYPPSNEEAGAISRGRAVFLASCAVCHSSKQPDGMSLAFSPDWRSNQKPFTKESTKLTLPTDFGDWEEFTRTKPYRDYAEKIVGMAGEWTGGRDPFLEDNFLSNEVRIPVTLVGTNSGRTAGTNAMKGQVWADFSSEGYKSLPSVGSIRTFNPYSTEYPDASGFNDSYVLHGGGPGYYRPASLIGLWATAPFLHNNALGIYKNDPSIAAREGGFEDGIDKLLTRSLRGPTGRDGDLRDHPNPAVRALAARDKGYIYRITEDSWFTFNGAFLDPLVRGVSRGLHRHIFWGILLAGLLLGYIATKANLRQAGYVALVVAVSVAALIFISKIDRVYPIVWILAIGPLILSVVFGITERIPEIVGRVAVGFVALLIVLGALGFHLFLGGWLGGIKIGPIPQGTPINLVMNMNSEAPLDAMLRAGASLWRGCKLADRQKTPEARLRAFEDEAALALMAVNKCPDFVLDRGHWFGESLTPRQKHDLKAFLKTL